MRARSSWRSPAAPQNAVVTNGKRPRARSRVQCLYRKRPAAEAHEFRFVADFAAPGGEVLALSREFDLIPSWNWSIPDTEILAQRGDMDMDVYLQIYLPWPFTNRRAAVRIEGADCLDDDGATSVVIHSLPVDKVREYLHWHALCATLQRAVLGCKGGCRLSSSAAGYGASLRY